jgi:hypothetical protein
MEVNGQLHTPAAEEGGWVGPSLDPESSENSDSSVVQLCYFGYVEVVVSNTISSLGQRRCGKESQASHAVRSADPPTAWQNFP